MKTNAWAYNEAVRDLAHYRDISYVDIANFIREQDPEKRNAAHSSYDATCYNLDLSAEYNSDAAKKLLNDIGIINITPDEQHLAEGYVYAARRVARANKTLLLYADYKTRGYISIHDITPEHDGKKAVLDGKQELDWLTTSKHDEPVVLVCNERVHGYRRPRMRTRYYAPQVDANLFVKLV